MEKKQGNKMEFYREKSKIWELFTNANIHSLIAPFGFDTPYNDFNFQYKCRIIVRPKEEYLTTTKKYNCEIKTLPRIHVKLAIGLNAILFGSFNFTKSKQQEIVCYSEKASDIEDALDEFDYWWEL